METFIIKNQKDLDKHKDKFGYYISRGINYAPIRLKLGAEQYEPILK
jgi:hypothetical protein